MKKDVQFKILVSSDEKDIFSRAAEAAGLTRSGWSRERLLRAAREELGLNAGEMLRGRGDD